MSFDKLRHLKMKEPPPALISLILLVGVVSAFVFQNMNAPISIDSTSALARDIFLPPPDILDKLAEKDDELARVPVSIGSKEIVYYENRYTVLSYKTQAECDKRKGLWDESIEVCRSVSQKRSTDKERVLGLKLLNTETGEVEVIAIQTKIDINGVSVVAPDGYQIEIVERPNGIRWNWWNTLYRVTAPENSVVIKNLWPREEMIPVTRIVNGKPKKETKKVVVGFLYVPHSEFFELEENRSILVQAGANYLKSVVAKAFDTLEERGIHIDREVLSPKFFERIPLLEQGDFTEFQLDPKKTVERVLIILGANKENAWKYTCNGVSACGWVQFTDIRTRDASGRLFDGTYTTVRKRFPAAKLTVDFREGAGDHQNSIMAAILLHKINLAPLVQKFGDKILVDPEREKYLAASYNGAPKWVSNSLNATISKAFAGWITALSPTRKDSKGGLRRETRDFMTKLDYLIQNDLP